MKVIRPITITPAKVLSSTATEVYSEWSSAITYNTGDRVIYVDNIYESLKANNLNKIPKDTPTDWLLVGATNKMSMFDTQVMSQTTETETLSVSFAPGSTFNTIAFLNIQGNVISASVKDAPGGTEVYSESIQLDNSTESVIDWYTYFFEEFDYRSEVVFSGIPPYATGVVDVTITSGAGEVVAIGSTSVGSVIDLGDTQYGLNYGIRDYSVKETNEFGNTKFAVRAYSKRMSPVLMTANTRLNYVTKTLENLRATPTVFIGTDDPKFPTTIYGFLKDWNLEISYPNHSMISIEVDGLI